MYQIKSEVYLDKFNECYKKIITIHPKPKNNKLNSMIKTISREKLSPFQENSTCCAQSKCIYAFINPSCKCELLCIDDIAILFNFLLSNGFKINTDITKIMLKSDVRIPNLICFIS